MTLAGNVFLIGPMGAGKSTIGRQLAQLLGAEFLDVDREIETRTGTTIPVIFEIEGEAGFRKRESAVLEELCQHRPLVLATGGGAILAAANRQQLRAHGVVVYLQAPLETLVKRTARDRNRPLLANTDRRAKLEELMREREPLYKEAAHLTVNTAGRSPSAVAREIARRLDELKPDANTAR
jgi:shikimate kinase